MIQSLARARIVFLDFDGVVVDSTEIKTRAFGELFADLGGTAAARMVEIHLEQQGIDRMTKIRRALGEFRGDVPEDEVARRARRFSKLVVDAVVRCPEIPGAIDFLSRLAGRRPVLLSGTPDDELQSIVSARGLAAWFSEILGSPPDKATSMGAVLARRCCKPEDAVLLGDSLTDLEAARQVGTDFIAINPQASLSGGTRFVDFNALLEAAGSVSFRRAG